MKQRGSERQLFHNIAKQTFLYGTKTQFVFWGNQQYFCPLYYACFQERLIIKKSLAYVTG